MEEGISAASCFVVGQCALLYTALEGISVLAGVPFQSEASIGEGLSGLRLAMTIVKDGSLQVPFPPLNKHLPEHLSRQGYPTSDCGPACETGISAQTDSSRREITSTPLTAGKPTVEELLKPKPTASVTPLPRLSDPSASVTLLNQGDVDWPSLAQQFIDILQGAVESRVKRAPRIRPQVDSQTLTCGNAHTSSGNDREGRGIERRDTVSTFSHPSSIVHTATASLPI